jgi:hypothetical protein
MGTNAPPEFPPTGWIAYTSNESGLDEVYARSFPGDGPRVLLSTRGGGDLVW